MTLSSIILQYVILEEAMYYPQDLEPPFRRPLCSFYKRVNVSSAQKAETAPICAVKLPKDSEKEEALHFYTHSSRNNNNNFTNFFKIGRPGAGVQNKHSLGAGATIPAIKLARK